MCLNRSYGILFDAFPHDQLILIYFPVKFHEKQIFFQSFKLLNNINIKNNPTVFYWLLISIAVIIGIYIRLKGLGTWPLALDEYYIIKASENILEHGLPQFINGGYYERGLLMQYLIAPLLAFGVKAEFAGRIITVIANLVAIPALYLIAKRIGNQHIAAIVVVIFSLSIWEIEFARFARMYTPFQTIFIWYIYFALKDFEAKDFTNFKWLIFLSVLGVFIYEGSIFLALLNFIPFVVLKKFDKKYLSLALIVLAFSLFYNKFIFFTLNSAPIFPPEYLSEIAGKVASYPIKIPKVLLPYSFTSSYFIFFTPIIILFTLSCVWIIIKNISSKNPFTIFAVAVLGIMAVFNQFGLFVLALLIFLLWDFFNHDFFNKKNMILLSLIFFINLIYWYIYGILSKEWYVLFDDFSSYSLWGVSKRLFVGFFNFPDNYISLVNYFKTLPILTVFSAVAVFGFIALILLKINKNESVKFLLGVVIFSGIAASLPKVLYVETRYTFFIIPIFLIIILYSVYFLLTKIFNQNVFAEYAFGFLVFVTFIFSRDFDFYHLTNIDNADVNYRMIYDNNFKKHLYRRWDIKTPTDFVKSNLDKNDLIMINENSMEYYLPRVDYFNFDYKHHAFVALSVENGKKERWSNAKLIYKNDDLINFIENRQTTIWYLVFPEGWLYEIDFYEKYRQYLVYQGVDGLIKVFKFPFESKIKQAKL